MIDLVLPRTDAGVLAQVIVVGVAWALGALALRRRRELVLFVSGLAMITYAWFGLRALH